MTTAIERRASFEVRAAAGRRLQGIAAPFGKEARIGDFVETIRRGAFASSLKDGRDILAMVDHDATRVLARTKSGTLQLRERDDGLHFDIALPETTAARDVLALAERGDLGGMSFGFRVRNGGESWQGKRRELTDVELVEVSVISAFPAYSQTSVSARARMSEPTRLRLARLFLETIGNVNA